MLERKSLRVLNAEESNSYICLTSKVLNWQLVTASTLRSVPKWLFVVGPPLCVFVSLFVSTWWVKPFSTHFYSSFKFLCCTVTPMSQVRGVIGIPLTCLTPPHSVCMCLSQLRSLYTNSVVIVCCCVTYLFFFVHFLYIN